MGDGGWGMEDCEFVRRDGIMGVEEGEMGEMGKVYGVLVLVSVSLCTREWRLAEQWAGQAGAGCGWLSGRVNVREEGEERKGERRSRVLIADRIR
jgi:hypothetical protein